MGWAVLSFGQNFLKRLYGLNDIGFWLRLLKRKIWVSPYCLLFKTFLEAYMGGPVLSFDQNFVKS